MLRVCSLRRCCLTSRPLLAPSRGWQPFWVDVYNFDKKRYTSLPQCEDRGTRDERMAKRQRGEV